MTPDQAADLAARTLAAIDAEDVFPDHRSGRFRQADRERVASDLAGLQECWATFDQTDPDAAYILYEHRDHAARYAEGLRRTAALYGVSE